MKTLTPEAPYVGLQSLRVQFLNIKSYPSWMELPLTGTNFHGPKPVQATEVLLYMGTDRYFPTIFKKGDKSNFLFAFLDNSFIHKGHLLLKEIICSDRNKVLTPTDTGSRNKTAGLLPVKVYCIL